MTRRIALFVEGDTERALPAFFHKWLDPQLPEMSKVGITAVKFQGVSNFLDELPKKVESYLNEGRANFVVGLVDLYGVPSHRIDLSQHASIQQKVSAARRTFITLFPPSSGLAFASISPCTKLKHGFWRIPNVGLQKCVTRLRRGRRSKSTSRSLQRSSSREFWAADIRRQSTRRIYSPK